MVTEASDALPPEFHAGAGASATADARAQLVGGGAPGAAELQRAATAVLSSAEPAPRAILRGLQPTVALLADIQQAADAAAETLARASEQKQQLHGSKYNFGG